MSDRTVEDVEACEVEAQALFNALGDLCDGHECAAVVLALQELYADAVCHNIDDAAKLEALLAQFSGYARGRWLAHHRPPGAVQ